jgi:integrase
MALKIIKSNTANAYRGYRPHWYGVYRNGATVTTFNLGVLIRGEPPASGYIGDKGDEPFEASRKRAEAKFADIRTKGREKGEAVREVMTIVRMKTNRKFHDPALADLADIYLKGIGDRSTCHLAMIRSGFQNFATFAANPKADGEDAPKPKKAKTLVEVTPELATAFFRNISRDFAFSTVKRWSNLLTGAFDRLAPVGMANPFKGARLAAVGRAQTRRDEETGDKVKVETVVHHRPIDRDQLRKLYAAAKDDPLLYPLTVTAASTGLRISDVCTLLWKDIHLTPGNPIIMVETTAKTGSKIAVPIFDYDPASPDYEPDLGEFRRVLEAALAEAKDGEKYVFPKAARLYLSTRKDETTGRVYFPGRDNIYTQGKALFARALFADEPEDAELVETDEKPAPTVEDILAAIEAAEWTDERKTRVRDIYTRHAKGESYLTIQAATGYAKSTISTDLATVQALVGVKVKARTSKKPSVRELLKRTRQKRSAGRRGASIYSWHSLRAAFVVLMKDNGVPLDTIRLLVGHTTTDMTLEYYNPTQKQAAESARQILTRRNRQQAAVEAPQTRHARTPPQLFAPNADAPRADLDALRATLAALTPEELAQLLKQTNATTK